MEKRASRRIPEAQAASDEEIRAAIERLTQGELLRLEKYARWRIRGLGRKAGGRTYEDLLAEAITATLSGDRRWNKDAVDFFGHLKGAMRSISDNWSRKSGADEVFLDSELRPPTERQDDSSAVGRTATSMPDGERLLGAHQMLRRIESLFHDDPLVLAILTHLREGASGPEIQRKLGISQKNFETAMKRMRRKVRKLAT
ncbi:MAG: hypothetical protein D6795_05360 [Deltaproteobacteria bacterium]|nr:MAG: hypothetical protein D6795_05360 [Deltaproteobacteria bacterium]